MHEAFGVQTNVHYWDIVEVPGLSTRTHLKQCLHMPPEEASATPQADEHDRPEVLGAAEGGTRDRPSPAKGAPDLTISTAVPI